MYDTPADQWIRGPWDPAQLRRAIRARGRLARADETPAEGHRRHRPEGRGRFGADPREAFGFPFGAGGTGGLFGRFPFGRGPKARRGDVRAAALLLLGEAPRNGYQLMQEIESRSGGLWRPSPGSIYPVLQQLEDEGLVRPEGPEGRRLYQLTEDGRSYVAENAAELGTPWATPADSLGATVHDFRALMTHVHMAAIQVMRAGNQRQVKEAQEVLTDARRRLYKILAEDDVVDEAAAEAPAER